MDTSFSFFFLSSISLYEQTSLCLSIFQPTYISVIANWGLIGVSQYDRFYRDFGGDMSSSFFTKEVAFLGHGVDVCLAL